jgi:mannose-6-phosphate isomerase-like protein (cupin superfamily)
VTFETKRLPLQPDAVAPDGAAVRLLLALSGGSMAHFELAPGETSRAVTHHTVEEIWYVVAGGGQMWRRFDEREEIVDLEPGVCITIPLGTQFQVRALARAPLAAIAITMPPWPGEHEAKLVEGHWPPAVASSAT